MRCFVVAILVSFLSFACARNYDQVYSFYSLKSLNAPVQYRISDFSAIFGDSLFERIGLFVFYEYLGVQRLYVMIPEDQEKRILVYQLPETKLLPWLHPEKYMEKRKLFQNKKIATEKCSSEFMLEKSLVAELDSLHLDRNLYVLPYSDSLNRDMKHVIIGFWRGDEKLHYFYYVKYDDFWEKKGPRFSVYADVFKIMEKINKKTSFSECR